MLQQEDIFPTGEGLLFALNEKEGPGRPCYLCPNKQSFFKLIFSEECNGDLSDHAGLQWLLGFFSLTERMKALQAQLP